MTFIVGLDLGQASDFTAAVVLDKTPVSERQHLYAVKHIERVRQLSYPVVVNQINTLLAMAPLNGQSILVIDRTGVGRGVTDLFRQSPASLIKGVTITGGHQVVQDGHNFSVPKADLVAAVQATGGTGRLKYPANLRHADILDKELLNFRRKLTTTNATFESWRESDHDDVLLALALACWYGERPKRRWQAV